ncbi:HAD-IB family phosphatase [Xenorhabdus nematophila]|uniref:HAD family hydrolase n=1 Tax=Xenorhabdus nematophila TaxID=628 RepID=UPI0032B77F38
MNNKILLLDICGTITKDNTTMKYLETIGIKPKYYERVLGSVLWRFFSIDYLRKKILKQLKGCKIEQLSDAAKEYVASMSFNNEVLEKVEEYRRNGYEIILVSATLDVIASEIAQRIKAKGYYASSLQIRNGICSGRLEIDLLNNKTSYVEHLLKENTTLMISDNLGDLSLMIRCNQCLAIVCNDRNKKFWINKDIKYIKINS